MEDYKISIREIQRMIFVSNALNDGWTVRRVGYEKYEFIKDNETYQRDISNHATLDDFLKSNSSISKFLKNKRPAEAAAVGASDHSSSSTVTVTSSVKGERAEKQSGHGKESKEKDRDRDRDREKEKEKERGKGERSKE